MIVIRPLEPFETHKLADIDRSEHVTLGYSVMDGELHSQQVDWNIPSWTLDGAGEFNLTTRINYLRWRMDLGDISYGAFDGDELVGYALLRPKLTPQMAQLSEFFVSQAYRRQGIGRQLLAAVVNQAILYGAGSLYVSAVPSESAVSFYLNQGFELAEEVHPELFAIEPEDIHMIKVL